MKCPVDNTTLVMTERNGVEIDYCPSCRGVWLDRGELDKIIDRNAVDAAPPVALPDPERDMRRAPPQNDERRHGDRRRDRDDDDDDRRLYRKKKRDSFLSELFDF